MRGVAICLLAVACGDPEWSAPPPRDGLIESRIGTPDSLSNGRRIWIARCAICHGAEGRSDGFNAELLASRPPNVSEIVERIGDGIESAITRGSKAGGRSAQCPPWEGALDSTAVRDVARWMRQLAPTATARTP